MTPRTKPLTPAPGLAALALTAAEEKALRKAVAKMQTHFPWYAILDEAFDDPKTPLMPRSKPPEGGPEILARLLATLDAARSPDPDARLIDTHPPLGGLVELIELELADHRFDLRGNCACGDAVGLRDPQQIARHIAGMIDYRLTATDGDA